MNVQLISLSKPVNPNLKTAEDLIVYCARVSNPQNQNNIETGSKLINYCIQHGHWSIFEQALYNTWDEMKEEDKKFFTSCLIGN